MSAPVLAEVTRGGRVESVHRGAVVVVTADGRTVLAAGDTGRPVYPRSAVKAVQALPLVASGAADALGLDDRALALACASHNAEPGHLATAADLLIAAGATEADLACGPTWPYREADALALAAAGGGPSALRNCCSGKHGGFLALARHRGHPLAGYHRPDHPVQVEVRAALVAATGVEPDPPAVDGCSAPTWPVPLDRLALAFARLATGSGLSDDHAAAAARLRRAIAAEPWHVAGTGRFDTAAIQAGDGAALVKYGAEGVMTAALPVAGLGVALKVDDGAPRAAEVALAAVLAHLLDTPAPAALARQPVTSRAGEPVGEVRGLVPLASSGP